MKLVIANKAYSSWSFRPWVLMKTLSIPFEEEVIPLYQADTATRIARYSQAGRLPVLIDGPVTVWDSMAIIEHLSETVTDRSVWPEDREARAHARSIANEMHSGFTALRARLPMNMRRTPLRSTMRPMPISIASVRPGPRRAIASAPTGRFSTAPSRRPMPSTRRSSAASTPMRYRCRRRCAAIWTR
jgi:glutathione S-transferase